MQTMETKDGISGALAECYITIGETRYNFMQIIDFESKMTKTKSEVPILGRTAKGNRSTGWKGTFSGKAHYNQSIIRVVLKRFKDTGEDLYFTIQVTNDDPSSAAGRQSIVHTGCNLDGGTLAKIAAADDYLTEDISGTFEDWDMPEAFTLLPGMV